MGNCCCGSNEEVSNPIVNTPREFRNIPPDKARMVCNNIVGGGGGGGARVHGPPVVGRIIKPDLKIYTFSELKSATRNFRPDSVLGEGGFGRVYKGWIDKTTLAPSKVGVGIPVAVKKCSADTLIVPKVSKNGKQR